MAEMSSAVRHDDGGDKLVKYMPQNEPIYWENVEKTSRLVNCESNFKKLNALRAMVNIWLRLSNKSDMAKKEQLYTAVYLNVLKRLDTKAVQSSGNYRGCINVLWVIYQQMVSLDLPADPLAVAETGLKLTLVQLDEESSNQLLISLIEKRDYFSDNFVIRLKELITSRPLEGRLVIDQLNHILKVYQEVSKSRNLRFTSYDFTITECLVYTLKKRINLKIIHNLLYIIPDSELDDAQLRPLLQQFFSDISSSEEISSTFASTVGRKSSKLAKMFEDHKWTLSMSTKSSSSFVLNSELDLFSTKNCYLLAIKDEKHFLDEILNYDLSFMEQIPRRVRLFFVLDKLFKNTNCALTSCSNLYYESIKALRRLATSASALSCDNFSQQIVHNLRWVFDFVDYATDRIIQVSDPIDRDEAVKNFTISLVRDLLSCDSPLAVLKKHGMINTSDSLLNASNAELVELLGAAGRHQEVQLWWAYLAVKLSVEWITNDSEDCAISSETSGEAEERDSIESSDEEEEEVSVEGWKQIKSVLSNITSLPFKTEVLENLFSLMFLTRNEIADDISIVNDEEEGQGSSGDDGTDVEARIETKMKRTPTLSTSATVTSVTTVGNCNFLCVNEVVPKYLTLLKEVIFEVQTQLRRKTRKGSDADDDKVEQVDDCQVLSSVKDLDESKVRLNSLLQYVNEAQWRYSVIEPAFADAKVANSKPSNSRRNRLASNGSDSGDTLRQSNQNLWQLESETESSSTTGETKDRKRRREMFSSVIPCMLASPQQLLRYCLLEGHVDRAKQVYKLFEQNLVDKDEARELYVAEKKRELLGKLKTVVSPVKKLHASRIAEVAARGLKVSQVHALFHEFMMEVNTSTKRKMDANTVLLDFGLCSAPSFELTQAAIESSSRISASVEQDKNVSQEKIQNFMTRLSSLILIARDSSAVKATNLPHLMAYNYNGRLFSDPSSLVADCVKEQKLRACIEDLKQLVSRDIPDHDLSMTLTSSANPHGHLSPDSKKLVVHYQKLLRLCPPGSYNYLKALFYHVRRVSKVLIECKQRRRKSSISTASSSGTDLIRDTTFMGSYFSVLYQSPSAILCQMVLKDGVPPNQVDDLANEMRVDLIGTLCSLLCPPIPAIAKHEDYGSDFALIDSSYPALCDLITCYLSGSVKKNMESILVQNHFGSDDDQEGFERKSLLKPDLLNYFANKSTILVQVLRLLKLYDHQVKVTSDSWPEQSLLKVNSPIGNWIGLVKRHFEKGAADESTVIALALFPKITVSHSVVMKALEDHAAKRNVLKIYDIFNFLSVRNPSSSLSALRRAVLSKLSVEYEDVKYILQIEDEKPKVSLLLDLIDESNSMNDPEVVTRAIHAVLASIEATCGDQETLDMLKSQLQDKLRTVICYSKISLLSGLHIWRDSIEILTEADVLTILKTKRQYNLALEWNTIRHGQSLPIDPEVERLRSELLVLAYSDRGDMSQLERLIRSVGDLGSLVERTLPQIDNWTSKEVLITIAIEFETELSQRQFYREYLLGIKLIKLLPTNVRPNYGQIVSRPFLIIEQMLMNTEYTALEVALKQQKLIQADELVEFYAKKSVDIQLYDEHSFLGSDTTCVSSSLAMEAAPFVMPLAVPSRDQWVPDSKVTFCMLCKLERFSSLFNRRHHCRRCGRVICSTCSTRVLVIEEINQFAPVRVCDDCFAHIKQMSSYLDRKESISSVSSSIKVTQWTLTLDDTQNAITRDEFYFEAAPSSSLCLSLTRLHSDKSRCVQLFLEQMVRPLFEVLTSHQVDYGLLINIIKSLLVSAKVVCEESVQREIRDRLRHIDLMLSRLDIVKMLVNQNCINKDLINCVIFNEGQQSMIKLQEKLLEMERFELALNIGMKHGLDVKAIWKTWAIICLKNGRFAEARQKFKHVLVETVGNGPFATNKSNSKHIQDIVELFEKQRLALRARLPIRDRVKQIKSGQSSGITGKELQLVGHQVGDNLPAHLHDEMMYYLKNYGSKEDYLKFYVQFNLWKSAIELFLLEANQTTLVNTFVGDFLLPAINKNATFKVYALIKSMDPTLAKSWKYLHSACRHLTKKGLNSVLYNLQLFMGDYLRAAMTQINCFYLAKPYEDYVQLAARSDHLKLAVKHCKDYLENRSHLHPGCIVLPFEQVTKQIKVVNMQMELGQRFSERRVSCMLPFEDDLMDKRQIEMSVDTAQFARSVSINSNGKSPLTLLDNSKARKTELAALVTVLACDSISDGFKLTQQIIKNHGLDASFVYRLTGRTILALKPNLSKPIELLSQLLTCIQSVAGSDEAASLCDDVISACIRSCSNNELNDGLIKLLTSDINKIDAYILSGKLKSAYLLAVRLERVGDVKRIMAVASRNQQEGVKKICQLWLQRVDKETSTANSNEKNREAHSDKM